MEQMILLYIITIITIFFLLYIDFGYPICFDFIIAKFRQYNF